MERMNFNDYVPTAASDTPPETSASEPLGGTYTTKTYRVGAKTAGPPAARKAKPKAKAKAKAKTARAKAKPKAAKKRPAKKAKASARKRRGR
ncbi:MAG TPA: hypothetical protein VK548_11525 [Candidatus Acidoferrum sp.]|nr:hypothetical protein [Candidatus Acidoferrum sp.]